MEKIDSLFKLNKNKWSYPWGIYNKEVIELNISDCLIQMNELNHVIQLREVDRFYWSTLIYGHVTILIIRWKIQATFTYLHTECS